VQDRAIAGFFKSGCFFRVFNRCELDVGDYLCVDHPLAPLKDQAALERHSDCLTVYLCPVHGLERPVNPARAVNAGSLSRLLVGAAGSGLNLLLAVLPAAAALA
jgi:hypothetical protein